MNILGLFDGAHDAGAALVRDNKLVSVINEERLTGIKTQGGFPYKSIEEILRLNNLTGKKIDLIVFGSILTPQIYLRFFRGMQKNIRLDEEYFYINKFSFKNLIADFIQFRSGVTNIAHDSLIGRTEKLLVKKILRRNLPQTLKDKPIRFVDHHTSHIYPAYLFSGKKEVLGITSDGVGDGYSLTINHCKDGKVKRIYKSGITSSLGLFYALVTAHFGYKPFRHEGKILGLAAHGNSENVKIKFPFKYIKGNILYQEKLGLSSRKFLRTLEMYNKEDVAAWLQENTEDYTIKLIKKWLKKTGIRNIALSGGLFTNVKVNQRIHDLPNVDSVFVFPHMGDGGLGIGAALYHAKFKSSKLKNVFMGPGFTNTQIKEALQKSNLQFTFYKNIEKEVAKRIAEGKVVARFEGKMEFGPRALGNRSILYQTTDKTVNDWLNRKLHRCYDEKTEILTSEGWKFMKNLKQNEIVMTLNTNKNMLELQKINKKISYLYNGLMYKIKNKRVDLLVTPNHNMWIKRKHQDYFEFKKIQEVNKIQTYHYQKKGGVGWKGKTKKWFILPEVHSRNKKFPPIKIEMNIWLKFLGYWLSEGSHHFDGLGHGRGHYRVSVAQSKKSSYYKDIEDAMKNLPFNFKYDGKEFITNSKQLYTYVSQFGRAKNKYVPRDILKLNKEKLSILFNALMQGDGNIRGKQFRYATTSKQLANDVQEISLKLGYSTYTSIQKKRKKHHNDLYLVRIGRSPVATVRSSQITKVHHSGKVYCISVPNKILVVKRNRKVVFCGNSEIMPFAPATLIEHKDKCYKNTKGAEYTSEFMTITFDCTKWMKETCPGVVHVDGTARPQFVTKTSNPSFYKIIDEYRKLTGIPSIINTSMNVHEYPIVCTPEDGIKCFTQSKLDYLAIGNYLVNYK